MCVHKLWLVGGTEGLGGPAVCCTTYLHTEHFAGDTFIRWTWNSGASRIRATASQSTFGAPIQAWVAARAPLAAVGGVAADCCRLATSGRSACAIRCR